MRTPWLTPLLALAAVATMPERFASVLQYDRSAVLSGQLWRLLTCQWTHWGTQHLAWDAVVFLVLGVLCEVRFRRSFFLTVLATAVAAPAAVHTFCDGLSFFRGLSGIDCALFGLIGTDALRRAIARRSRRLATAVAMGIALFATKTAIEAWTGRTLFVDSTTGQFVVVPVAHLAGFVIGAAVGAVHHPAKVRTSPGRRGTPASADATAAKHSASPRRLSRALFAGSRPSSIAHSSSPIVP
jgi:rhomboid family GlyGly-CTERM serine protease